MPETRTLERWLAPRRIFLMLALMVIVALLLVPWRTEEDGAASLTSYAAAPGGARGFFEILERLGFSVERRLLPMRDSLAANAVYVVLEPRVPFTASEVRQLLDAVRAGATLLTVPPLDGRLADSLHVSRAAELPEPAATPAEGRRVFVLQDSSRTFGPGWVRWVLRSPGDRQSSGPWTPPQGATVLLALDTDRGREPMVVGLPMGEGRIVIAADPGLFRNSTLQEDPGAVRVVRYLEWLQPPPGAPIVFDEYHHGHGTHASVIREAERALTTTAPGRVVLQIAAAGLLLLLAVGMRPVRPRPVTRIERRSPLEHVGALARAYAAVRATPRASRLLVRGLQRRHHGTRATDERRWLHTIAEQHAQIRSDVERVGNAMDGVAESGGGAAIAASAARIEQALGT